MNHFLALRQEVGLLRLIIYAIKLLAVSLVDIDKALEIKPRSEDWLTRLNRRYTWLKPAVIVFFVLALLLAIFGVIKVIVVLAFAIFGLMASIRLPRS